MMPGMRPRFATGLPSTSFMSAVKSNHRLVHAEGETRGRDAQDSLLSADRLDDLADGLTDVEGRPYSQEPRTISNTSTTLAIGFNPS